MKAGWGRISFAALTIVPAVYAAAACNRVDRPPAAGDGNVPGFAALGGPCAPEGAVHECHVNLGLQDGIPNCFVGKQECRGGTWSTCAGGDLALQSVGAATTLQPLGLSPGSTTSDAGICASDPCDPYCTGYNTDAGLRDDAGVSTGGFPSASPFGGAPAGFAKKSDCGGAGGCNDVAPGSPYPRACNGAPTHYSIWDSCLADTHCDRLGNGGAGACVPDWTSPAPVSPGDARWNYTTNRWSTSVCPVGAGPDLTVTAACIDASGVDGFSICNRGNDPTTGNPGGANVGKIDLAISSGDANFGSMLSSATGCTNASVTLAPSCSIPIPGGSLAPGACIRVTNANCAAWTGAGNPVAKVNPQASITECGGVATGSFATGPACNNNWADVKSKGTVCSSTTVYAQTSYTYSYSATCLPGFQPKWRWLTYQASVPSGGLVQFYGTLSSPYMDAGAASYPEAIISAATTDHTVDCENGVDAGAPPPTCPVDLGAWSTAITGSTPYMSLDLRIVLTPPAGGASTPVVPFVDVSYDCVPTE